MSNRILIADLERRMAGWRAELEQAEAAKNANTWTEPVTGLEFLRIPAGTFIMGSPETEEGRFNSEGPQHEVTLSEFRLAATTVTNRQYRLYNPEHTSQEVRGHSLNGEDLPAVYVNWDDAQGFIEWLNAQGQASPPGRGQGWVSGEFCLPSEAQWEYACRAGTGTARFWGNNPDEAAAYANVYDRAKKDVHNYGWAHHDCDTGFAVTSPVGSFEPNAFGLYDTLGNIWEWCRDIYAENAYNQHKRLDPIYATGTGEDRVLRGGSWLAVPRRVRCAFRGLYAPSLRYHNIGFRLARTLL